MLALPWIATGVFIYQSFIAESKFWDVYIYKIIYDLFNNFNFDFNIFWFFS